MGGHKGSGKGGHGVGRETVHKVVDSLHVLHLLAPTETTQTIGTTPIDRLYLDTGPPPMPKFMAYYRPVSYVLFGIHVVYSIIYLIFVATKQSNDLLYIQYDLVYSYHNYNSYSLLCPVLGIIFIGIFIYHVKYRVKLNDGDFFGLIGIQLLLTIIIIYDTTGVYHLYTRAVTLSDQDNSLRLERINLKEQNELAWQYAWSTKPTCARYHASLLKRESEENLDEANRGPRIINLHTQLENNYWMYGGLNNTTMYGLKPLSGHGTHKERKASGGGHNQRADSSGEDSADRETYEKQCNSSFNLNTKIIEPRVWMKEMQKKFKCCGPRGWEDWQRHVALANLTCKNKEKTKLYRRSCTVPFHQYLAEIYYDAVCVMLCLAICFLMSIITACFHFAAMKYDETKIQKEYSLLNVNPDEGIIRIDINQDRPQSNAFGNPNPVQHLFNQANIRAERQRLSHAELHFPAALVDKERKQHAKAPGIVVSAHTNIGSAKSGEVQVIKTMKMF